MTNKEKGISTKTQDSKKPRRKLKSQVRKTLAGVFLASAVVVAAVPAQGIKASGTKIDDPTYPDTRASINYNYITADSSGLNDDLDIDELGVLTPPSPAVYSGTGQNIFDSYSVRQLKNGDWTYNWQFKYYVKTVTGGNIRAIISEYNSIYPEAVVTLSSSATVGYVTVTNTQFNTFMDDPTLGSKEIEITYSGDFLPFKTTGNLTENMKFHDRFNKSEYDNWIGACERYYESVAAHDEWQTKKDAHDDWQSKKTAHDTWEQDKKAYDDWVAAGSNPPSVSSPGVEPPVPGTEPEEPGAEPTIEPLPGDLKRAPKTLSVPNNYKYYVDYYSKVSSTDPNYIPIVQDSDASLISVTDNVAPPDPSGIANSIYIVNGGTAISPAYLDDNGFLVKDKSIEIVGIASADYSTGSPVGSFAGISNVDELTLPDTLYYIGNGAFEGSFIKKIEMNVLNVGNYAFRNCTELAKLTLNYTQKIGSECFKNTGVTSVLLPYSVKEIGYGAFSQNRKLTNVDLSAVNTACDIHNYAFFNDFALNDVNMRDSAVKSIGEGTFALTSAPSGSWTVALLPDQITGTPGNDLGDLLFAGRGNLDSVVFPTNFGTNTPVTVPSAMFKNCTNLSCVDFNAGKGSINNGYANFEGDNSTGFTNNNLFRDVTNPDFYVSGPEKNNEGKKSYPRQSTWQAFTTVSDFVPYVYYDSTGTRCYEVSDGTYLLQANANKELTSCELVDQASHEPNIKLVIPKVVGDFEVETIAPGCFDNDLLRERIISITIDDDSLISIDDEVFKGLTNLKEVHVGNSVAHIGAKAFADCNKLTDVYFNTPSVGYDAFTIGNEAFKTGSPALTFHGDIAENYAPFTFATGKDSGKIDDNGKRICYMTNSPTFLTCMYDNKSGEVVLLDYPKYKELDDRNAQYIADKENEYYDRCGSDSRYDNDRNSFYQAWVDAYLADPSGTLPNSGQIALYDSSPYFGPWLSDANFTAYIASYNTEHASDPGHVDLNPATVTYPDLYFDKNPYSIIGNYEHPGTADYQMPTDEEFTWINACLYIDVPSGITSIDAKSFFDANENTRNVATYFGTGTLGRKSYEMCTQETADVDGERAVPGLFSGYYQDYDDTPPSTYEQKVRGNDRILGVSLNTVKALPDNCFDSCERLEQVSIGDGVTEMGKAPFRGCDNLFDIIGNDNFAAENKLIYIVNPDGTYTIKECLSSRGKDGDAYISSESDPAILKVSGIEEGAFEQCDSIVRVDLSDADPKFKVVPKNAFHSCDNLMNVFLPETVDRIEEDAFTDDVPITVEIPAIEVDIVSDAFDHNPQNTIRTFEESAAYDYAKYYGLTFEKISDTYDVVFLDYDGETEILSYHNVPAGQSVDCPDPPPTRKDYTFTGWGSLGDIKTVKVTKNLNLVAQYKSDSDITYVVTFYDEDNKTVINKQNVKAGASAVAPLPPTKPGKTFKNWVPNAFTKVTHDMDIIAIYEASGPQPTQGPQPTSGPKPTDKPGATPTPTATPNGNNNNQGEAKKYTVTVSGGSGTGTYAAGAIVPINAYDMGTGQKFDKWTTSTAGVGFAVPTSPSTYFVMPAANVAVTATYKTGSGSSSGGSGSSNDGGSSSNKSSGASNNANGTTVEVTKGGISNTNLAGASVSGSTDNFVVKVTDDQNASDLALTALQNRFGDITNIKYLPMDISLYDSTGRTKITDTSGISVSLTLPLPDELAPYAGNNRVASVATGNLEDLNSRFTTVDGVPCISFTATHFSPYVIYVDTANLTETTIDYTPKTGDPIHPKWFLSIGLACVSVILFFKRDRKKVKVSA